MSVDANVDLLNNSRPHYNQSR